MKLEVEGQRFVCLYGNGRIQGDVAVFFKTERHRPRSRGVVYQRRAAERFFVKVDVDFLRHGTNGQVGERIGHITAALSRRRIEERLEHCEREHHQEHRRSDERVRYGRCSPRHHPGK